MTRRTPEVIVSDYLSMFVGDDAPTSKWLPNAQVIMNFLADEGYVIVSRDDLREVLDGIAQDGLGSWANAAERLCAALTDPRPEGTA